MRTFLRFMLAAMVIAAASILAALAWMTAMPGSAQPSISPIEDITLQSDLRRHVAALAFERHTRRPDGLDRAADYVQKELESYGYEIESQWFETAGVRVRNLIVTLKTAGSNAPLVVVGAHYDSANGTPGADDNASGVAALLELARALRRDPSPRKHEIQLVFFTNEEPPYFRTQQMGSYHYAERLFAQNRKMRAMLSLEMLGYFCDVPGCQQYPFPQAGVYPDKGNFIGFVGNIASRDLTREVVGLFRRSASIGSEGIAAPASVPGIDFSDQLWFWSFGYPAVMVTDTSFLRNPHYHQMTDTPEKLDYVRMARVLQGLVPTVEGLAR